mmetsp:Transcript_43418/g.112987  ORF Transcript_43418/g.112987 Transcript_43418/m.112987 type:complete len:267 (-) Transcript_43418:39-839(-)
MPFSLSAATASSTVRSSIKARSPPSLTYASVTQSSPSIASDAFFISVLISWTSPSSSVPAGNPDRNTRRILRGVTTSFIFPVFFKLIRLVTMWFSPPLTEDTPNAFFCTDEEEVEGLERSAWERERGEGERDLYLLRGLRDRCLRGLRSLLRGLLSCRERWRRGERERSRLYLSGLRLLLLLSLLSSVSLDRSSSLPLFSLLLDLSSCRLSRTSVCPSLSRSRLVFSSFFSFFLLSSSRRSPSPSILPQRKQSCPRLHLHYFGRER